ncbi:hypothetical protein BTVI_109646 [Pitangus sulphuratus]|nr:hypothetical protein BTVI_109646 [Pitangus sulphuratus]
MVLHEDTTEHVVLRELTRKDTLIDLLFINRESLMSEVEMGFGHSDHEVIEFKSSVDRRKSANKTSTLDMSRLEAAQGFKVTRNVEGNKKTFFKDINGNRQYRINIGLLQDEDGHLIDRDRDKAEVFNAFFASVFNMDDRPRGSQYPQLEDHDCRDDQLPVDLVWDFLLQLDSYKSEA